jgi:XTP/dITP diphosphohydrolase
MKSIIFATKNEGKIISAKRTLTRFGINVIHCSLDLPEPRSYDLELIATEKALAAFKEIKKPLIAIDAGFYISSLGKKFKFPGPFINPVLDSIGIKGILKLVEGKKRECEFKECLAFYDGYSLPMLFQSRVIGTLSRASRGENRKRSWSSLAKIFIPAGSNLTLAQMDEHQYGKWTVMRDTESSITKFADWYIQKFERN